MSQNFFGYLLQAFIDMVDTLVIDRLPHHTDIGLDSTMASLMTSMPIVFFIIAGQFLRLRLVIGIFIVMLVMEGVRGVVSIIRLIKTLLPLFA